MPKTVLLVCSEDLRAQLSLRMVRSAGIEAERVKNPEDVDAAVRANGQISLILCDWRLRVGEAANWIERWQSIPVLPRPHLIIMADRLPTHSEAGTIFQKGVSDVWIRPLPDYLLVPRVKVWLSLDAPGSPSRPGTAAAGGTPVVYATSPGATPTSPGTAKPIIAEISTLVDPDTRLVGRDLFLEYAEGMFAGSRRLSTYVGCLAVALVNLDEVARILGPLGRAETMKFLTGELRRVKRKEDVMGRWNDNVIVVATYFPKGDSVQDFGRRLLTELQSIHFPHAPVTGPLRFMVSGAWGPSRDYPFARDTFEAIVTQARAQY